MEIKTGARIILTVNTDLQGGLLNRQLGSIKHINLDMRSNVTKLYIKSDDCKAELKKINTDNFGKKHFCVPIEKTEVDIRIKATKSSSPIIK